MKSRTSYSAFLFTGFFNKNHYYIRTKLGGTNMCRDSNLKRRPIDMVSNDSYKAGRKRAENKTIPVSAYDFPESVNLYYYGLEFYFLVTGEKPPQIDRSELAIAARKESSLYILLAIDQEKQTYNTSEITIFLTETKLGHLPLDKKVRDINGEELVDLLK